jgi:hypothetical protein
MSKSSPSDVPLLILQDSESSIHRLRLYTTSDRLLLGMVGFLGDLNRDNALTLGAHETSFLISNPTKRSKILVRSLLRFM